MIENHEQKIIDTAIRSRRSIRAFLPTPVERADIEAILEVAARAPSGTNTQPWKVYVLTGTIKDTLSAKILQAHDSSTLGKQYVEEYAYYPREWQLPYIDRRLTVDRVLERGSWLDYGMFLQNIMIAARGRGLDTCPQAAFTRYHRIIADMLQLPASEMVVCGMAPGYADNGRIENTLLTERAPVSEFVRFVE